MNHKAFTALAAGALALSGCTATTAQEPVRPNPAAPASGMAMALSLIHI